MAAMVFALILLEVRLKSISFELLNRIDHI